MRGRTYVLPQDVFDVAPDILRHRLVLSYEALARDVGVDEVLARFLSTVPAPRVAPSQDHSAATLAPVPSPVAVPASTPAPAGLITSAPGQLPPPPSSPWAPAGTPVDATGTDGRPTP